MADSTPPTTEVPVIFKSKKNRKQIRARAVTLHKDDDSASVAERSPTDPSTAPAAPDANQTPDAAHARPALPVAAAADDDDASPALSGVLRRAKKARLQGVAFRAETPRAGGAGSADEEEVAVEAYAGEAEGVLVSGGIKQFAPQTGILGNLVNHHMDQYVESRLSKRHQPATDANQQPASPHTTLPFLAPLVSAPTLVKKGPEGQKPTQSGKLMEVDLGDEARMKNIDSIERAKRQLIGTDGSASAANDAQRRRWARDRRASDEIKRDQVVEAFLHENKLDVYDHTATQNPTSSTAAVGDENLDDLAADDRVAEKFRRDFMEAMSQRIRRRRAARAPAVNNNNQPARPGAKRDDEMLKGPKLGGSRNTRAQMRDILLQKEKDKGRGNGNIRKR
ncbi:uncharacterized protein BROUX77_001948 [Berkeleyomyces rouxiae]|uniref:uncharacterized protein n=1 Tax=Berkeleyomyces rouxiae TaxID=2035830 RepID=UPI003B7E9A77